jgi:PAS domain S-box-containing protein
MTLLMRWTDSIVTRLIAWFCMGGLLLSGGFTVLEYDRSMKLVEVAAAQELLVLSHKLQEVLAEVPPDKPESISTLLDIFQQDPRVIAVRLHTADGQTRSSGAWEQDLSLVSVWAFSIGAGEPQGAMDFSRPTLMLRSFLTHGRYNTMELLLDGPYMRQKMSLVVLRQLGRTWILLGALALAGLLVLRRGLAVSLARLTELALCKAPVERFERASVQMRGELSVLAGSIAQMLRRIDLMCEQVRRSQRAYEHLYQYAPAAMVSLGAHGRITHANRRASELFDVEVESLLRQEMMTYVHLDDRPAVRRAIRRLRPGGHERCMIRLESASGWEREVDLELVSVHDEGGEPSIRVNLIDMTEARRLEHHLSRHRHLLELLADYMTEAILLVGDDGRIVKANLRVTELMGRDAMELCGERYDPVSFWEPLGLRDPEGFRLSVFQAMEQPDRPTRHVVATRHGSFSFQIIPVRDESLRITSRLWVVQHVEQGVSIETSPA